MRILYALLIFLFSSNSQLKAGDSLSLYLFLLDDCPICIQYTPTINELYSEFGSEIAFVGYFPNFSSKKSKIDNFKNKYYLEFPLLTDYYKTQAKKYNAQVTPEVILYNNTKNEVIYQGRIDNKFYKLGRRRNVVTEHNLREAILSTLNDSPVEQPFMEPIGCFINYSDNFNTKTKNDKE